MEISHIQPEGWGLCPVIPLGPVPVSTYAVFMLLAFAAGIAVYRRNAARTGARTGQVFPVVLAAVFGGVFGAKIPVWALTVALVPPSEWRLEHLLVGRTIAGGFVGGMLAVWWVKRRLGLRARFGNVLAPAVALGMAVGRVGCLLSGCCHGRPTALPWGVDFGDGVPRHPTQVYEIIFCLAAFLLMQRRLETARPGALMTGFLAAYFVFRFAEEFLRPQDIAWGLTVFQWICLAGLLLLVLRERLFRPPPGGENAAP